MTSSLVLGLVLSAAWTTSLAAGSQQARNIPGPSIVGARLPPVRIPVAVWLLDGWYNSIETGPVNRREGIRLEHEFLKAHGKVSVPK